MTEPQHHDPFGVRAATAIVMAETTDVAIDDAAVDRSAERLLTSWGSPPAWDTTLHYHGTPLDTAGWVVVLDALNFCFWAQGRNPRERWQVTWRGTTYNGYDALAAALHRAVVDDGTPVWETAWLRSLEEPDVRFLLRGNASGPMIPLLGARLANLRELGERIESAHAGTLAVAANGSAITLIETVLARLPSFRDVATWNRTNGSTVEVPFLKRAQILAADLAGALAGAELAITEGLEALTAFADYKVPQVLRQLGILRYAPELATRIARLERIPAGSREEIAIRSGTVQACEQLTAAVRSRGQETTASELDWRLWTLGQALPGDAEPYHRTVTIFY
ncbi:MAG: queuosine salvage family protein [Chloroflexota bacterium]|nr:queuosine salvage family protein [Chloroflexota bacterium]